MVKFSNCVYVFVFFALISFLAFFPLPTEKQAPRKGNKKELVSPSSSIPQKVNSAVDTKKELTR
jgi:hypothetical protein